MKTVLRINVDAKSAFGVARKVTAAAVGAVHYFFFEIPPISMPTAMNDNDYAPNSMQ